MNSRRILIILLILYALIIVSINTIVALGQYPSPFLTPLSTLLGFAFALLHAGQRLGWRRALILFGLVFAVSLIFESVGVVTGLVYGPYHYSDRLGPLFFGLVPLLIPIAWFMMMYPSLVITDRLVPALGRGGRLLAVAVVGGLVMTAWDVVMDPVMVRAGHWVWEVNGDFFGIPPQNFWGWWLTTFIAVALYLFVCGADPKPALPACASAAGTGAPACPGGQSRVPHRSPALVAQVSKIKGPTSDAQFDRLALLLYVLTGFGEVSGALILGLGGAALAGFFAMVPWAVIGWLTMSDK